MKHLSIFSLFVLIATSCSSAGNSTGVKKTTRYFTFELSENVVRTEVTYTNRYGVPIAADLYMAKGLDTNQRHPAIVIGPPNGGVKEQGPGVYANQLAQRGFVVLAFDPPFYGDSGGEPRNASSPEIYSESFSAGVDYLGTRSFVDLEKIGAIGICGSGGFALSAAQVDMRIKAIITTSMYDISRARRMDLGTGETRKQNLDRISRQRWTDFENGYPEYNPAFPAEPTETIPDEVKGIWREFYSYYGMKRGHHPHARAGATTTSLLSWANFSLLDQIATISPRPILFIVGENATSRFFSDDAYAAASQPKELMVVAGANHVDLYDDLNKIPFDKMESFFKSAFNN